MRIELMLAALFSFSALAMADELQLEGGHGFNAQHLEASCVPVTSANIATLGSCDVRASKDWWDVTGGSTGFSYKRCVASPEAEYIVFACRGECEQALSRARETDRISENRPARKTESLARLARDIEERPRVLDCQGKDGLWTNGGGLRPASTPRFCQLPSTDAGKSCKGSSDCSSRSCISRKQFPDAEPAGVQTVGWCTKYPVGGGCVARVESGMAHPVVCTD